MIEQQSTTVYMYQDLFLSCSGNLRVTGDTTGQSLKTEIGSRSVQCMLVVQSTGVRRVSMCTFTAEGLFGISLQCVITPLPLFPFVSPGIIILIV